MKHQALPQRRTHGRQQDGENSGELDNCDGKVENCEEVENWEEMCMHVIHVDLFQVHIIKVDQKRWTAPTEQTSMMCICSMMVATASENRKIVLPQEHAAISAKTSHKRTALNSLSRPSGARRDEHH